MLHFNWPAAIFLGNARNVTSALISVFIFVTWAWYKWNLTRLAVHDPCPNQEQLTPGRYCCTEKGVMGTIWRPDARQFVSTISLIQRIVGSDCVLLCEPVRVRNDNSLPKHVATCNNVNVSYASIQWMQPPLPRRWHRGNVYGGFTEVYISLCVLSDGNNCSNI